MPNETTSPYIASSWGTSGKPNTNICSTPAKNPIPPATPNQFMSVTDDQLKAMLVKSPIVVGIYAGTALDHYSSGVFSCSNTSSMHYTDLNHAVQLVGYDTGSYIIKNSWGTSWGQAGFAYINSSLDCGMKLLVFEYTSTTASLVTLDSPPVNNNTNTNNTNGTTNSTQIRKWEARAVVAAVLLVLGMVMG